MWCEFPDESTEESSKHIRLVHHTVSYWAPKWYDNLQHAIALLVPVEFAIAAAWVDFVQAMFNSFLISTTRLKRSFLPVIEWVDHDILEKKNAVSNATFRATCYFPWQCSGPDTDRAFQLQCIFLIYLSELVPLGMILQKLHSYICSRVPWWHEWPQLRYLLRVQSPNAAWLSKPAW